MKAKKIERNKVASRKQTLSATGDFDAVCARFKGVFPADPSFDSPLNAAELAALLKADIGDISNGITVHNMSEVQAASDDDDGTSNDLEEINIVIGLSSRFGSAKDFADATLLERQIMDAIDPIDGCFDGNSFGNGEYLLFLSGDDAAELFDRVKPILRKHRFAKGGYAYQPGSNDHWTW